MVGSRFARIIRHDLKRWKLERDLQHEREKVAEREHAQTGRGHHGRQVGAISYI